MSVLRGVPVAAAALRLQRGCLIPPAQQAPSPQEVLDAARAAAHAEGFGQGRQAGWQQGHDEGLVAGRAEAAREAQARAAAAEAQATAALREQQDRLAELGGRLAAAHAEVLAAAEDDLVALAYETLARLLPRHAFEPQAVRATLQAALARAAGKPRVLLRLHPEDARLLDAGGLQGEAGQVLAWCADAQVALGGCVVETADGALDLRLESLLADCRAALLRAREERRAAQQVEAP